MSRDIRSFFLPKKVIKSIATDDDDVIPESPEVQTKKKNMRKKRILSDDSDDELTSTSKKKKIDNIVPNKGLKGKCSPQKHSLKEVKAIDIFGSSKVKRTEPLVKKKKKNTETGIHSDEEFDQSLLALDEAEALSVEIVADNCIKNEIKSGCCIEESSNSKNNKESNKNGLDSTLLSQNKNIEISTRKTPKKSKLDQKKELPKALKDTLPTETSSTKKESKTQDFSEFLENNTSHMENEPTKKKNKINKSLNDSVMTDEERHERKQYSHQLYQQYLNRSGPKHLGSKEIPKGSSNCLSNCAFLLTGVLDSFERDEVAEAITKYGGSIKNAISKKVTHVLAGEDAGPAKMAKAQDLGIKIITEDEFLQLIIDSSEKVDDEKSELKKDIKKENTRVKKSKSDDICGKNDKTKNGIEETSMKMKKEEKFTSANNTHTRITSKSPVEVKSEPKEISPKIESVKVELQVQNLGKQNSAGLYTKALGSSIYAYISFLLLLFFVIYCLGKDSLLRKLGLAYKPDKQSY